MIPSNKLYAGGFSGALAVIVVWALHQYGKVEVPAEIAMAFQTVIVFVIQYFVPNSQDQVKAQLKDPDVSGDGTPKT